jgi:class 3 adenylate cyclase
MGVEQWLQNLGLTQYAQAFAENDIDFDILAGVTDADLKELGVGSLGHRKRLLAAIDELRSASSPNTSRFPDRASGERRQVTILFADLCGFTTLSRSLDPEEIGELVARFTAQVDGIVVGYGGTVDKHIGDAVMALFGAPRAHDDDPLRAVRAALDIHAALARSSGASSHALQAHVGIASGEVVAGTLSRVDAHDYTVLGNSVNLAARLVALAGPNETLLSEDVYRASPIAPPARRWAKRRSRVSMYPCASGGWMGCRATQHLQTAARLSDGLQSLSNSRGYLRQRSHGEAARLCACAAKRESERRASLRKCAILRRQPASPRTVAWCSILGSARDRMQFARCFSAWLG